MTGSGRASDSGPGPSADSFAAALMVEEAT